MNSEEYLTARLDDQLNWLEGKSAWNQKRYRLLKVMVLVLSVSIPFLAGEVDAKPEVIPYIIGVAGVMIAFAEGLINIYKYHDNWIQYRATAEALKRESFFFKTATGPYRGLHEQDRLDKLVTRVEDILGEENQEWKRYIKEDNK